MSRRGPRINTAVVSPVPKLVMVRDRLGSWSNNPHGATGPWGKSYRGGEGAATPLIRAPPQAKTVSQKQYRMLVGMAGRVVAVLVAETSDVIGDL